MAGRHIGLMSSEAFDEYPVQLLRTCLGSVIGRDELRMGLNFLQNTLSGEGWMG